MEVSKDAKIRNRYNQVPHLTQDTNGKVTIGNVIGKTKSKQNLFGKCSTSFCLLYQKGSAIYTDIKSLQLWQNNVLFCVYEVHSIFKPFHVWVQ